MSNIATLSFDASTSKWVASFGGQTISASGSKEYVIGYIKSGQCRKANQAGVTGVRELGVATMSDIASQEEIPDEKFGINERFDFLTDFVNMVADRTSPSLLVTGEGGLGKTFTVNKALQDAGLTNSADSIGMGSDNDMFESQSRKLYSVVKGYSTAKGLYRTLYENRNRIVVFDDCDSILKDQVALNLLKGALDSYERRIISWNAESFGDDDLPRSFEFKGGVIFISNMPVYKVDQAVRSRAIVVDLSMNLKQKIERMGVLIKSDEFLADYSIDVKFDALAFLDTMKDKIKESSLNLRTLISVTKVAARGGDWQRRAEYLITTA